MKAPSDGLLVPTATKQEYGTQIFARVNFADHVFWRGYGHVFFFFRFWGHRRLWPQKRHGSVPFSSFLRQLT